MPASQLERTQCHNAAAYASSTPRRRRTPHAPRVQGSIPPHPTTTAPRRVRWNCAPAYTLRATLQCQHATVGTPSRLGVDGPLSTRLSGWLAHLAGNTSNLSLAPTISGTLSHIVSTATELALSTTRRGNKDASSSGGSGGCGGGASKTNHWIRGYDILWTGCRARPQHGGDLAHGRAAAGLEERVAAAASNAHSHSTSHNSHFTSHSTSTSHNSKSTAHAQVREGDIDAGPWPAQFHTAFYAQVWCTYRWACMPRMRQSLLVTALQRVGKPPLTPTFAPLFPPTSPTTHATHAYLVPWFLDAPGAPLGVHRTVLVGKAAGKDVGITLVDVYPVCGLGVSVATDGTPYQTEVYAASRSAAAPSNALGHSSSRPSSSDHSQTSSGHSSGGRSGKKCDMKGKDGKGWGDRPVLLMLDIRLWRAGVNPVYHETIKSVGIAGARPSSSYYFVSAQGGGLFSLDPHHLRPAVPPVCAQHAPRQHPHAHAPQFEVQTHAAPGREMYTRGGSISPEYGSPNMAIPTSTHRGGADAHDGGRAAVGARGRRRHDAHTTHRRSRARRGRRVAYSQAHFARTHFAAELHTFHCERVRKMPLMGKGASAPAAYGDDDDCVDASGAIEIEDDWVSPVAPPPAPSVKKSSFTGKAKSKRHSKKAVPVPSVHYRFPASVEDGAVLTSSPQPQPERERRRQRNVTVLPRSGGGSGQRSGGGSGQRSRAGWRTDGRRVEAFAGCSQRIERRAPLVLLDSTFFFLPLCSGPFLALFIFLSLGPYLTFPLRLLFTPSLSFATSFLLSFIYVPRFLSRVLRPDKPPE
ncbi:hypothetical protein DFH09DRAFT_1315747 [Mycena vulgaris]|nr:hypothetical protein DFH09DRAFT_1315747 [Mycena vulgaris]